MMLKDSKAIQRLADESPDIFTRIKDVITGIVNDIKNAFKGVKGSTYEYKRMEEFLDDWEGVQKLWDDAFVSASKNANKAEKAAETESENSSSNIMYELKNNSINSDSLPDFEIKNINGKDTVVINERRFPRRDISNREKYNIVRKQVRNMLNELSRQSVVVKNNGHEI